MTITVRIAELKNRLSHYLRRVQRGDTILVCDRDRVIARIERVEPHATLPESDHDWLERLERRGVVRRASATLTSEWLASRPEVAADIVAAVLRERDESR